VGRKPLGSTYFRESPLNELCRSRPSDVKSRYSTSAVNTGSTHVAFGLLTCLLGQQLRRVRAGAKPECARPRWAGKPL